MAEGAKGRLITGARARLSLNGQKVGYARNVNVNEMIEHQPAEVLDNIEVEEHVPIAYRVGLTFGKFKVSGETLKSKGLMPSNGRNSEEHLENILTTGDMSAIVEDTKTGNLLATVTGVRVTSNNWTIDRGSITGEDVECVAIRTADESETGQG